MKHCDPAGDSSLSVQSRHVSLGKPCYFSCEWPACCNTWSCAMQEPSGKRKKPSDDNPSNRPPRPSAAPSSKAPSRIGPSSKTQSRAAPPSGLQDTKAGPRPASTQGTMAQRVQAGAPEDQTALAERLRPSQPAGSAGLHSFMAVKAATQDLAPPAAGQPQAQQAALPDASQ